jgi:hypothetical protein
MTEPAADPPKPKRHRSRKYSAEPLVGVIIESDLGPAMLALSEKQRRFVLELQHGPAGYGSEVRAARAAGYAGNDDVLRAAAYKTLHHPKVQEALREAPAYSMCGSIESSGASFRALPGSNWGPESHLVLVQFDDFFGSTISKFGSKTSNSENSSTAIAGSPAALIFPDWIASAIVTRRSTISSKVSRVNMSEASAPERCLLLR